MRTRRGFLQGVSTAALAVRSSAQTASPVTQIDIVHHTHTDIGYTDLPSVVRDKQIRYLNSAIGLCRLQPSFRWTVESLVGLQDWWQASDAAHRKEFLGLVRSGRMDVMGLPFNQTPLLDVLQWQQMMEWRALWLHRAGKQVISRCRWPIGRRYR